MAEARACGSDDGYRLKGFAFKFCGVVRVCSKRFQLRRLTMARSDYSREWLKSN